MTVPMASSVPFALYNPALLSADALLGEFIARRPLLETLLATIRQNAPGHAPQHGLLVGPRGMGKTTTLWAVAHSVNRDPELARAWQPVVFDEESRRVGDLADFWLEAIRQWEHATQDTGNRTQALLDDAGGDIEDRAREIFLKLVGRSGRRALLLIDNLNDVLASISDPEPLHRLRAFLMEESRVTLIGGATRTFPQITDLDQPFYDFFRVFELKPLSLEEMKACLLSLAATRLDEAVAKTVREREGTMRSLHLLTGGNPRLVKTFYRLLAEGLRGDIRADLERLLDEFTPYFKAIVDALPVQQQRIFDAVALNWDPVDVATIAHATRVPSNQVSAQLRALMKAGHVAEPSGHPKRRTYFLADRFSNIHYLMRHGRAARSRFDWFVAILRLIFPDQAHADTLAKVARQTAECGPDGERDARDMLHSALNRSESADSRRELVHATIRESWDSDTFNSFSKWFDAAEAKQHLPESEILAFFQQMPTELRKRIGYKPGDARWWYGLTRFLREKAVWSLVEAAYRKAIELDPKYAYPWNGLGNLLQRQLGRPAEAEVAYREAIKLDPELVQPWNGLGNVLSAQLGRPVEAEVAYREAIKLDPKDAFPWNGLGNVLQRQLGRPAEAEAAYRKAIELDSADAYPWNGLGNALSVQLGRPAEAEAAYREAIKLDPKYSNPWNGLGNVLCAQLGRTTEAEAAYRRAIELDSRKGRPWAGLAKLLGEQRDRIADARRAAVTAVLLNPAYGFTRSIFRQLCANDADDLKAVLPNVARWCAARPTASAVFSDAAYGFIQLARLTSPREALAVLDSVSEAAVPFETLRDSFLAHADKAHLDRLAPERRVVAIELLNRINAAPDGI